MVDFATEDVAFFVEAFGAAFFFTAFLVVVLVGFFDILVSLSRSCLWCVPWLQFWCLDHTPKGWFPVLTFLRDETMRFHPSD